ncbi:hypothetical protein VTJ04DRAFT_1792 [Mycothermus thermophilus]|uniref:uncharacterized protein n=1 Tax=Humicola insolens TaxID=85995 RepID=UPI0037435D91
MLSIKKLIPSPNKKQDVPDDYEGSYFLYDDEIDTFTRIKSWIPPPIKKRSKPSLDVPRQSDDFHHMCGPALPDTPQSSTTSLSSIDNGLGHGVRTVSPQSSPPRRSESMPITTAPSPQRSPQRSPLLQPQSCPEDHKASRRRSRSPFSRFLQPTPPASPPQHISMMPEVPCTPLDTAPGTFESASNGHVPAPDAVAVTQPSGSAADIPSAPSLSQQPVVPNPPLVPNAADGTALPPPHQSISHAKLSDSELAKFPKPKDRLSGSAPARRKSQKRRSGGSVRSVKSATKAGSPLSPAQARLASGTRPKRAKSKKARRRPRATARQSSILQLTESAKDLFTIRLFNRIEVDEMLPESTLREIRRSRAATWTKPPELGVTHPDLKKAATMPAKSTPTPASESAKRPTLNISTETAIKDTAAPRKSTESLGLKPDGEESKAPTSLSATQAPQPEGEACKYPTPGQESVTLPDSPTNKPYSNAEEALPIANKADDQQTTAAAPTITAAKLTAAPINPPQKAPLHRRNPSRQLPPLPTIPEVVVTAAAEESAPATESNGKRKQTSDNNSKEAKARAELFSFPKSDKYIYLASNPYTMTMPTFRHGPIRLDKEELNIDNPAAAVDDTLDWTAFQMAILGGAGDFFSEPTDYSRPSERELDELEELTTWFQSFGFMGPGALVGPPPSPNGDLALRSSIYSWTPVMPRTPGSSISSSSSGASTAGGAAPAFRRIDPPSIAVAPNTDSVGRFYPTATTGPAPEAFARHRRSASSIAFGQPVAVQKTTKPQYQFNPPQHTQFQQPQQQQQQQQLNNFLAPPPYEATTAPTTPMRPRSMNHASSLFSSHHAASSLAASNNYAITSSTMPGQATTTPTRRTRSPSMDSLPQSPMMDLVVSHDVEGNEYMVPMGFNLSHDLGDFLTWHAEHVSGVFGGGEGA